MKSIIEAQLSPGYQFPLTTGVELRIYVNSPFVTYNGEFRSAGSPNSPNSWYLPVVCEIQPGGVLYRPSFEIDSTEDSPTDRSVTYTAWLFANGARVGTVPFLAGFAVPAVAGQTWTDLILHRDARNPPPRQGVYDIGVVEYKITEALAFLRMASETQVGMAASSEDPIDPGFPIHVSVTDPNYLSMLALLANRGSATLVNGAAVVGSTEIAVNSNVLVSSRGPNVTGVLYVDSAEIVPGASFTIRSTNIGDNGDVSWMF